MPFFFHLKLELYPALAASTSINKHLQLDETETSELDPYIPVPGTDIFRAELPAHKTSKWSSYTFSKRPDTSHTNSTSDSETENSPHRIAPTEHKEGHGDALLLPERTLNRNDSPRPRKAVKEVKPSNEAAARDWRYGRVSLESIDMEAQTLPQLSKSGSAGGVQASAKNGASGLHTKAVYIPSDPKTTEMGWGVVHLYRDNEESPTLSNDAAAVAGNKRAGSKTEDFDPDECTTLAILAVPSWMMPSDLLGFVGDQAREDVSHFRLIRTGRTNKYMVLMKFRSAKRAREWQKTYNGRLFSAAEPENCHVVFIKSVEFLTPSSSSDGRADEHGEVREGRFPQNQHHDPFTPASGTHVARAEKSLSSKPLAPPPPNLLELPTCPVCLERMDETTGLLTILCQHVFHCACLEKWRFPGSGCPVCRYTQSPSYTFPYPRPSHSNSDEEAEPVCSVCASGAESVNLWICLICGSVGCGRYDGAHAYAHYEETSHCYAMDISTQHVWDYAGDGYVHRLIQSKPDFSPPVPGGAKDKHAHSGLIDLGSSKARHENEAYRAEAEDMVPREKMETMANEYTYLLTSQLEGQRRYFEEQVERAVDKASAAAAQAESASTHAERATSQLETMQIRYASLESSIANLEKSLDKSEQRREKFEAMARELTRKLKEEQTINAGLMERIKAADSKAEEAKKEAEAARVEKAELEEMNRDLTMFISGQEKIRELEAQGEEVVDGSVSLPEQKQGGGKKGKGRKR